jgi:oligopeptide transport system permease protein
MRVVEVLYSVPDVLIVILLGISLKEPLQKLFDAGGLQALSGVVPD